MATYYVDPVSGNNANDGLSVVSAKQTINGLLSSVSLVNNDIIELLNGTHTLTANASVAVSVIWKNYSNHTPEVAGSFSFTATVGVYVRYKGLIFKNASGTNGASGPILSGNSGNRYVFEDCIFDLNAYSAGQCYTANPSTSAFYNCTFRNWAICLGASSGAVFHNCIFELPKGTAPNSNYLINDNGLNMEFIGCKFIKLPSIVRDIQTAISPSSSFKFCTFDLTDGRGVGSNGFFYFYQNASNKTAPSQVRVVNCIFFNVAAMRGLGLAGTASIENYFVMNNWIKSGTDLTGYNSLGGDITAQSDPEFYDETSGDYRLEPTSTAAIGNNGLDANMGAEELEHPTTFFTQIVEAKVESGYAYKSNSRTNNKTGTLAGGGETDVNKVLNTSTVVSGLYVPPAPSDVKTGVNFGVSQTGTYDGSDRWTDPGEANVRSGTAYKANSTSNNKTGTAAIPSAADVKLGVAVDATTGTLESTDPGEANVVSGINYKIESVSKTGTRTAIYPLLPANQVQSGVDRGDGSFGTDKGENFNTALTADKIKINEAIVNRGNNITGTYVAAERYSDPTEQHVKHGTQYKFNSETNNRSGKIYLPDVADVRSGTGFGVDQGDIGTLDIDLEANLPDVDDVLTGSGAYGENLDQIPAYTPDFPAAANVRETDTTNGVAGLIPNNKIAPSQGGSYLGQESNDDLAEAKVENGFVYNNLGVEKTGTLTGSGVDEKYILYPLGTLGQINSEDADIVEQLTDNAKLFIQNLLGSEWEELRYFKELEKNDAYNNKMKYGIRALGDNLTFEKIGNDTVDLEFEIKLTTDFDNRDGDEDERLQELMLVETMESIRRQLRSTKFFKAQNVRIVKDFTREEVEKYGQNGLVCRAVVRVNLNIKNA